MIKILLFSILLAGAMVKANTRPAWEMESYVTSSISKDACRPIWHNDGSLCNKDGLITYHKAMADELSKDVLKFKEEVESMRTKLQNPENKVSKSNHQSLSFYKSFSNEAKINSFKRSVDGCASFLNSRRWPALCHACSAKNQRYFLDNKAIITDLQCFEMATSCWSFFEFSYGIVNGFSELSDELNKIDFTEKKGQVYTNFLLYSEDMKAKITKAKLHSIFNNNGQSSQTQVNFCHRFYKLDRNKLIMTIAELLYFVNRYIGDFVKVLNRTNRRLLMAVKEADSRELQNLPDVSLSIAPAGIFEGDVAVWKTQDNMFSSFDGIQGSSAVMDASVYRPMNLSVSFP